MVATDFCAGGPMDAALLEAAASPARSTSAGATG